jgi:hypothetical protein
MTPETRKAALEKFRTMLPTEEREALRKAIEAADALDATVRHHADTAGAVTLAQQAHQASEQRLAQLTAAQQAAAPDVQALLVKLGIVDEAAAEETQ